MAIYLGSDKFKLHLGNKPYCMNLYTTNLILNGVKLLSSEGYVLRDKNGTHLTAKESE